ncbi:MAG: tripartite tricarboxylate transporter substrate binding protein [Burkholderiales bacterium]
MLKLNRTLFAAALIWAAAPVSAQQKPAGLPGNYPNKPIRVIVPASPGGGTDIVSRIVGQRLAERWITPVVIENRGSAVGGIIGMDIASKATPDGYTLLAVSASAVLNAALVNKTAYDQRVAFAPIVQLTTQPYLLAIPASLPVQSVAEMVALAKAKPGALNYGSAGNGSMSHLGGELFNSLASVNIAHIPYKGTGPALTDLLGGQVQMLFAGGISITPQTKTGRLRVLGHSGLARTRLLPGVPSIAESGLPGFELNGWYGWLAPAGTPLAVVQALNREVVQILNAPDMLEKFANDGSEPAPGTPEKLRELFNRDIDKWTRLFERIKVKL